jgi:hypothetical protein
MNSHDKGFDEAADRLAAEPALRDQWDRMVLYMERQVQLGLPRHGHQWRPHHETMLDLVAEARGEEPEATLARLGPDPRGFIETYPS